MSTFMILSFYKLRSNQNPFLNDVVRAGKIICIIGEKHHLEKFTVQLLIIDIVIILRDI
jgi:hypothetical protein